MYEARIYYQDTDAGGVVYFANYLRFFEKSWFEYLLSIGISLPEWERKGSFVMVRTASVDLLEKLRYGDIIRVTTAIKEVKNAYFLMTHTVWKEDRAVTRGETKMVSVDQTGKPVRMPALFKACLLEQLEAKETSL